MEKTEKIGKVIKTKLVENVKRGVESSGSLFVLSYSALSASQMDDLRKKMRNVGAKVYVSQNRIAKIALKELQQEKLAESIESQTAFIWSNADSVAISKALIDFTKGRENVALKGGLLEGSFLGKEDVKRLSDLPSREALLSKLLQLINSPATRLASAMNAKTRDLLSILKQLSEKKEGGN